MGLPVCPKLKENVAMFSGVTLNFDLCFVGQYIMSNRLSYKFFLKIHQLVTNMKKKYKTEPAKPYSLRMFANTNMASAKHSTIRCMCVDSDRLVFLRWHKFYKYYK